MSLRDIENYKRFDALVQARLPADLVAWWLAGTNRFNTGQCKTLCFGLGLRDSGLRKFRMREFYKRRNVLFKFAASNCKKYPGETLRSRCDTLSEQINRFPRLRNPDPLLIALHKLYSEHNLVFKITAAGILKAIKKT